MVLVLEEICWDIREGGCGVRRDIVGNEFP